MTNADSTSLLVSGFCTCMATGKSFWASGGKKTSTAFFGNGWFPVGGVPTSMMWSYKQEHIETKADKVRLKRVSGKLFYMQEIWFGFCIFQKYLFMRHRFPLFIWINPDLVTFLTAVTLRLVNLTFPPACPRTAKQNRVDSSVLPSILNCAKPAACPSIGCDTFLSTEYSCIAPTTRFCWRVESHKLEEQSFTVALRFFFSTFFNNSASSITKSTEIYNKMLFQNINLTWKIYYTYTDNHTPDNEAFSYYTLW